MYLLKFETKIVQFESLVYFCSFNSLQISVKANWLNSKKNVLEGELKLLVEKKRSLHKHFWSSYREVLSVAWPNFIWSHKISEKYNEQVFYKKAALKNFAIFTGKNLCWSLFLNENAGRKSSNIIKERLHHRSFPIEIAKFLIAVVLTQLVITFQS